MFCCSSVTTASFIFIFSFISIVETMKYFVRVLLLHTAESYILDLSLKFVDAAKIQKVKVDFIVSSAA